MSFQRPRGDITTVLDLAPRTNEDDAYFPLNTPLTWFYRSPNRRTINFAPQLQTTEYRGSATFGQTVVFDINTRSSGDLLHALAIQIDLESWISSSRILDFLGGRIKWAQPQEEWTWVNSLAACLIESAEFQIDDVCIERIDTVFSDIFNRLFPDINTQLGVSPNALGTYSRRLMAEAGVAGFDHTAGAVPNPFNPNNIFTIEDGKVTCVLPFWFLRGRYKESFPLVSCSQQIRIAVKIRSYEELVRRSCGFRDSCEEIPKGMSAAGAVTVVGESEAPTAIPIRYLAADSMTFNNLRLLSYGSVIDGPIRDEYLRKPFEVLYRELNTFTFDQPLKYSTIKSNSTTDVTEVLLPLECNGPIEEIIWVVRRKAVRVNNEWTNYGPLAEKQLAGPDGSVRDGVFGMDGLVQKAAIQVNGQTVVEMDGDWFRRHIAEKHRSGIVAYNSYIYGYSFASSPGIHQPSGWANMSRAQNVRLKLWVRTPYSAADLINVDGFPEEDIAQTWEIFCYTIGINWMRFENGMCGRVFSS